MKHLLSRRHVLRGLGTVIALPLFESLAPRSLRAADVASPRRLMFVYAPNGKIMDRWTPAEPGPDYKFTPLLEPLAPHRQHLLVLSGLSHAKGEANGDGPGDHARASASFLTGAQPRKTASTDIRAGISIDQIAAAQLGKNTRFASLELGCDKGRQAGSCDSGYSCAYQFNLAWKSPTLPLPPEVDPRQAFQRLFASENRSENAAAQAERKATRRSILDFALNDARKLAPSLSRQDSLKLEQFLDSIRELERRIELSEQNRVQLPPGSEHFTSIPEDYAAHIRMMFDLALLAFQTDSTRVITLMLAHDGSNRSYPFIGVPDGHHDLTHHGGNKDKIEKVAKINAFHLQQFATFVEKLAATTEACHSLLDQTLVTYGSGLADGNHHTHKDLPVLVAGHAPGKINPGRHVRFTSGTPMCNLFVSLLHASGVDANSFGDSTSPLSSLS